MSAANPRAMDEGAHMITWVLVEEPTLNVERAIQVVESRLGSDGEVSWVTPIAGPVQPD